jgi:transposase
MRPAAAMEIARILAPHVARVVVANAQEVRAISHARVKSGRFDARTLGENHWHGAAPERFGSFVGVKPHE